MSTDIIDILSGKASGGGPASHSAVGYRSAQELQRKDASPRAKGYIGVSVMKPHRKKVEGSCEYPLTRAFGDCCVVRYIMAVLPRVAAIVQNIATRRCGSGCSLIGGINYHFGTARNLKICLLKDMVS